MLHRRQTGPHTQRRGSSFSFRTRIPADIAAKVGRRELVRALATGDPALARWRAATVTMLLPKLWARARMVTAKADLEKLIDEWFDGEVKRAWKEWGSGSFAEVVTNEGDTDEEKHDRTRHMFTLHADLIIDELSQDYRRGDFSAGRRHANAIISKLPEPPDDDGRTREIVAKAVMQAMFAIQDARVRWAEGEPEYVPQRPVEAPPEASDAEPVADTAETSEPLVVPQNVSMTLGDAVALYLERYKAKPKQSLKNHTQKKSELQLLCDVLGAGTLLAQIEKKRAGTLYTAVETLPPGFRKHEKLSGLSIPDMVFKARELRLAPMHPRTANGYLSTYREFFRWLENTGEVTSNPFAGVQVKEPPQCESDRGFSPEELSKILSCPLFMGAKSSHWLHHPGNFLINDWRFWSVLIALTTCARVSEIAQLRPEDLRQEDGMWVISIDERDGKRVKTVSSVRRVPVHSKLVRIGLVKLAQERQQAGRLTLLPDVPKPVGGDPGKGLSRWMAEKFLPRLGIARPGGGFHSFRHALETAMRDAGIDSHVAAKIAGHTIRDVGGRYGKFSPSALQRAVESIGFPPELSRIPARDGGCAPVSGDAASEE